MQKLWFFAILLSALLLTSCDPVATFDKPQPDKVRELSAFPGRVQGNYLARDEKSVLKISGKLITRHYDVQFLRDSLSFLPDSADVMDINHVDTLFQFSPDNVLKKFKGYYFLSNRYADDAWKVKKLSLKKGVLTVAELSEKEDLQKLREITDTPDDTASTNFSPTKRQFKKFVKQDGFGKLETFTKMGK